ncbi:hypothetical protein AB4320_21505 [Vibrio splendidus]
MEKMKSVLYSIEIILKESHDLSAYSAVRILLSDLTKLVDENKGLYPGIMDIKDKIMFIEVRLLSYLGINVEDGFHDGQQQALVDNALYSIRTILNRDIYKA